MRRHCEPQITLVTCWTRMTWGHTLPIDRACDRVTSRYVSPNPFPTARNTMTYCSTPLNYTTNNGLSVLLLPRVKIKVGTSYRRRERQDVINSKMLVCDGSSYSQQHRYETAAYDGHYQNGTAMILIRDSEPPITAHVWCRHGRSAASSSSFSIQDRGQERSQN